MTRTHLVLALAWLAAVAAMILIPGTNAEAAVQSRTAYEQCRWDLVAEYARWWVNPAREINPPSCDNLPPYAYANAWNSVAGEYWIGNAYAYTYTQN